MADRDFPHASTVEGLRFTAQVAVPNVIQGLFRRRKIAAGAASAIDADGLAVSFLRGLKRSYGSGPVWIRVGKDEALLVLGRESARYVLERSPDPFAADPEPKRSGMMRFQPDALTISRDGEWEDRRRFTDAVLGEGMSSLRDRFASVCVAEAGQLPYSFEFSDWNAAVRRVTRRIVLGEAAADDEALSSMLAELMDKSNPPGRGDADLYSRYLERLSRYVDAAEEGSLVGLFDSAPVSDVTRPAGQVTHWLFALGDTLAINAFRCLAALAVFDDARARVVDEVSGADLSSGSGVDSLRFLGACLQEAMRLWPTTAMLSRVAVRDVEWDGVHVPVGTQVLIVNTFNHRDQSSVSFADRFAPEEWLDGGSATEDWAFNHFSHGPQGCPGTALSLFVGKAMLGKLLRSREVRLVGGGFDPSKAPPYSLDFFGLRFEAGPRTSDGA